MEAFKVRRLKRFGMYLWWVCHKASGVPYYDIFAPTGYGYKTKAQAEKAAQEIEDR